MSIAGKEGCIRRRCLRWQLRAPVALYPGGRFGPRPRRAEFRRPRQFRDTDGPPSSSVRLLSSASPPPFCGVLPALCVSVLSPGRGPPSCSPDRAHLSRRPGTSVRVDHSERGSVGNRPMLLPT